LKLSKKRLHIRPNIYPVSYIKTIVELCDGQTSNQMGWKVTNELRDAPEQSTLNKQDHSFTKCCICKYNSTGTPLFHACSCKPPEGVGHIECFVKRARSKTAKKMVKGSRLEIMENPRWIKCSKCHECYTGDVQTGMSYGFYKHDGHTSVRTQLEIALKEGRACIQTHEFSDACDFLTAALAFARLKYNERTFCDPCSEGSDICFMLATVLSRAGRFEEAMNVLTLLKQFCMEFDTEENNKNPNNYSPMMAKINVYAINICATSGHLRDALKLAEEDCKRHLEYVTRKKDGVPIPNNELQNELCVMATLNYARLLLKSGQRREGVESIIYSYRLSKKLLGPSHLVSNLCYAMSKCAEPSF